MKGMGEADEGHLDMYCLMILDMYRCPTRSFFCMGCSIVFVACFAFCRL